MSMFKVTIDEPALWMTIYCLLFYIYINFSNRKKALSFEHIDSKKIKYKGMYRFMLFCSFILLMTNIYESDYFSYARMIQEYKFSPFSHNHGEPIYGYIAWVVDRNYFLFRAIVWGGALYLLLKVFDVFRLNRYLGFYLMFSMYFTTHFISRAAFAYALYFIGFGFLFRNGRGLTLPQRFFAIGLILLSVVFHKSSFFLVLITPLVFLPINKRTIIAILLIFPLLLPMLKQIFDLFAVGLVDDIALQKALITYSKRETAVANWKGLIRSVILIGTYYFPVIYATKQLYFSKTSISIKSIDRNVIYLYKLVVIILLSATAFLFMGFKGDDFYNRTMWMTAIPNTVLMCYLYKEEILLKKQFYRLMNIGIIYQLYVYAYSVYVHL